MSQRYYRKTFTPLESDPEVFTNLGHSLGLSENVVFKEIITLDEMRDPSILAYILVFPTTSTYEQDRTAEEKSHSAGISTPRDVVFYRQTIHNACGLYAILHAMSNGTVRRFIKTPSFLNSLLAKDTEQHRQEFLEESEELERLYKVAASAGWTQPPEDPDAEVDYHYTCFVADPGMKKLYELDGDRREPLELAALNEDLGDFNEKAMEIIQQRFQQAEEGKAVFFNVLALAEQ